MALSGFWTISRVILSVVVGPPREPKENVPSYDLIITRGHSLIPIEIKYDLMSDITGNYCLEQKSLEQTKSDYLVIGTPNLAYILPVEEARKLF